MLRGVIGEDTRTAVQKIDGYLLTLFSPKEWTGSQSEEVKMVQSFEEVCTIIAQRISRDPKKMTAFEFLQTLETLKKQDKETRKRQKRK